MSFTTTPTFELADPAAMRALAHPVRLAILHHLLSTESATATECGRAIGESASTCSYHLRVLGSHGIVSDVDSVDGREHRWSLAVRSFNIVGETPEQLAAGRVLAEQLLRQDDEALAAFVNRRDRLPAEWNDAATVARSTLYATPEELRDLRERYIELLRPLLDRSESADIRPENARRVRVMFRAVPWATPDEST